MCKGVIQLEPILFKIVLQENQVGCGGSYNDEWMEWCTGAGFFTFNAQNYYLYEIKLNTNAKILTIDSFDKYMSLDKYITIIEDETKIDWNKVKLDYDGVSFLNYQQIKKQMYNSKIFDIMLCVLDISCCCIWNPVYNLELLEHIIV
jgi:hypothetical protein